jgi:hypothetical protein
LSWRYDIRVCAQRGRHPVFRRYAERDAVGETAKLQALYLRHRDEHRVRLYLDDAARKILR